ncbi:trypsin-like peptidase domain-containing protein, partial [Candidatus Nomurabacteria bacterium]|nr:trypsin-like peptidase domain-containing protein [Candidatus Nomurabacteria bacterium]
VVSIIISKEVPKYSVSYQQVDPANDPFGGLFPGISLQTPVYTQDGTEKKEIGSGSGFLISSDGLIVTNRHVVASKDAIYEVLLNNGKKYQATVLARDTLFDVAIMKITAKGLPYLELADSDVLEVGQSVVAIGNALGEFKNTVSAGVVSGLSRSLNAGDSYGQTERLEKVIQTDAAINPGNSGGPLLNLKGEVVGINVAIVQGSSNIGFALPINSVKSAINSVKKSGKIIRPYIGVRYVNVTADLKIKKNLAVDYGVLVGKGPNGEVAVIAGSPADKAGIVENDIILSINGQKIDADHDFSYLIRSYNIGDSLKLRILSAGVEKTVTLRLAQAPDGV